MKKKVWFYFFLFLLVLGCNGCNSINQQNDFAGSTPIELYLNPATKGIVDVLDLCDMTIPEFDYRVYYASVADENVYVHFGEPNSDLKQLIPLTYDDFSILLNPNNLVSTLSISQIQQLFGGRIDDWRDVGGDSAPVQVYIYSDDSEIEVAFEDYLMNDQSVSMNAEIVSSIDSMKEKIAGNPASIGFIPASVSSEGFNSFLANVRVPILVSRGTKTPYAVDRVLNCLQSDSMQIILLTTYSDSIR